MASEEIKQILKTACYNAPLDRYFITDGELRLGHTHYEIDWRLSYSHITTSSADRADSLTVDHAHNFPTVLMSQPSTLKIALTGLISSSSHRYLCAHPASYQPLVPKWQLHKNTLQVHILPQVPPTFRPVILKYIRSKEHPRASVIYCERFARREKVPVNG